MDNKPRKLFAIKQSKGCKFIPKMQQNTFGGLTSWGRADLWPQWGGATSKGREGRGIRGLLLRGTEGGKEGESGRKGRGGNSLQSQGK